MEDDFDAVVHGVEQVTAPHRRQHRIVPVVDHVVRGDGRVAAALQRIQAPLDFHQIVLLQKVRCVWQLASEARVVHALANFLLNLLDGVAQLLGDRVAAQALDVEVVGFGGEYEECDDRHVGLLVFQQVIEAGQRFDEHVGALVAELVAAGDEQVQRFVQIEIEVAVEVAAHKLVDLLLGHGVQILELVNGRKLLHIQPVRRDDVGLPLQQVLGLVAGDLGHGGEHVRQMRGRPFDAIAMVDLPLARLIVHRKLVQIVVEVRVARAQVPAQQRGVRREHGRHLDAARPQRNQPDAGLPLVELGDNARRPIPILFRVLLNAPIELVEEVADHVAKDDGIVRFDVQVRDADVAGLPQVTLERVHFPGGRTDVEQNDLRIAVDQPAAGHNLC